MSCFFPDGKKPKEEEEELFACLHVYGHDVRERISRYLDANFNSTSMTHLIAASRQTGISLRQHAFHPQKESSLDLIL